MMEWDEYVAWTDTTALPAAGNLEYVRTGILEEANEFLAAYFALQAAKLGRAKRVLRGDAAEVLAAKDAAIERAQAQMVAELGDLAWYVARVQALRGAIIESRVCWDVSPGGLLGFLEWCAVIDEWGAARSADLLGYCLQFAGVDLDAVLDVNVQKLTDRKAAGTIQGAGDR